MNWKKNEPFNKENFLYDEERDEYICPEGNRLKFNKTKKQDGSREYHMAGYKVCLDCKHYGVCTQAKRGRTIRRLAREKLKEELSQVYASPEGQKIYALRKEKAELPFGHIKRNLGAGYFLLRGRQGLTQKWDYYRQTSIFHG